MAVVALTVLVKIILPPLAHKSIISQIEQKKLQPLVEDLKKKYGCALASLVDPNESIEVEGVGGRKPRAVLRQYLCEVIEPRAEETLHFINNEILKSGYADMIGSGLVVTGGASQLDGLIELGEFVFDVPVRRGTPENVGGLIDIVKNPTYSTAVGLLQYGWEKEKIDKIFGSK